tara:strand:+ start:1236 stop:1499 length:264 start_codon:yes stop_codon:yes gene_type:complete
MNTSQISDIAVNVKLTFYQVQILRELAIEEKHALFEDNGGEFEDEYINELTFINESLVNVLDDTIASNSDKVTESNYDYEIKSLNFS